MSTFTEFKSTQAAQSLFLKLGFDDYLVSGEHRRAVIACIAAE